MAYGAAAAVVDFLGSGAFGLGLGETVEARDAAFVDASVGALVLASERAFLASGSTPAPPSKA